MWEHPESDGDMDVIGISYMSILRLSFSAAASLQHKPHQPKSASLGCTLETL